MNNTHRVTIEMMPFSQQNDMIEYEVKQGSQNKMKEKREKKKNNHFDYIQCIYLSINKNELIQFYVLRRPFNRRLMPTAKYVDLIECHTTLFALGIFFAAARCTPNIFLFVSTLYDPNDLPISYFKYFPRWSCFCFRLFVCCFVDGSMRSRQTMNSLNCSSAYQIQSFGLIDFAD